MTREEWLVRAVAEESDSITEKKKGVHGSQGFVRYGSGRRGGESTRERALEQNWQKKKLR